MSYIICTPAPEARHKLAQPVRAGNPRAEETQRRRCDTRPFHIRMSTKRSHLTNGGNGGRNFSSDIKARQIMGSVDPGLQPRPREAPLKALRLFRRTRNSCHSR